MRKVDGGVKALADMVGHGEVCLPFLFFSYSIRVLSACGG